MSEMTLVLHGLAIKKHAGAEAVAGLIGVDATKVKVLLAQAVTEGRAVESGGAFMLTPLARMALEGEYSRAFADQRANAAFMAAYERFEVVNKELKQLITDWQTISVGGQRVPNDHSNKAHDSGIIDRLGALHERAEVVLKALGDGLKRLSIYATKLLTALEKAEDGEIEWVSGAKIESYHTVWFELHEDLLRILGRERDE
ncbi:MAG: hypothetical protein FJX66_04160 [Alphaproteobacteria bacterium]|nr:hypothetical protein [Alphaproteobacteria bacterium]